MYLIDLGQGKAYEATIVWRGSGEAGLRFSQTIVLDGTTPKDMKHLRDIWLRSA